MTLRGLLVLSLLAACKRTDPPVPAPAPAVPRDAADPDVVFRDRAGRVLRAADLVGATGDVDWSLPYQQQVTPDALAAFDAGRTAGARGDYPAAVAALQKAHDAAPAWPYPLYELAYTYELMNQPAMALPVYEQVVKLAPRGFFTALTSADCLRREAAEEWPAGSCKRLQMIELMDPAKRDAELTALSTTAPTLAPVWKDLALGTDDDAKQIALLDKALAARPDPETRGFALLDKALALSRTGKRDAAVQMLGELALDPASPLDVAALAKVTLAQLTGH